jgi:glucose/arabinose dehydrogenase
MSSTELCSLANGVILDGFCAYEIPIAVGRPRSVRSLGVSDMLVLERDSSSVVGLFDTDGDGIPDRRDIVATASGLNHGLEIRDGYLYASSDSTVYRWVFDNVTFQQLPLSDEEIIVNNINEDGKGGAPLGHTTRTIEFDNEGEQLYISVGSYGNVDPDSFRSRIRRVNLTNPNMIFPTNFQTLEVFADGLRNAVGLSFDIYGTLWAVDNGADRLAREDLGGAITEDNVSNKSQTFSLKF